MTESMEQTPLRTSRDDNIQGVALLEFTHARDVDKVASVKKVKVYVYSSLVQKPAKSFH